MKLSVIIPVFNEQDTIEETLKRVKEVSAHNEIIIVDDFSTDGTRDLLEEIENRKEVKIIYHDKNMGKGTAIKTALRYVTGDVVIIQDADLEYNPQEFSKLLKPIENKETRVVYGSRFEKGEFLLSSYLANRFLTFTTNLLYFSRIRDMETCYKCIDAQIIKGLNLQSRRFEFEPEVTAKLLRKGIKIVEVPISYKGRNTQKGKKIGFWDGVQAIYTLIKWRVK